MKSPMAAIVSGGIAVLAAVWLAVPLPVARIEVSGNERLARAEIVRLSGVRPPVRMTFGDARRTARALAAGPAFESVRVARGLTGTLHLGVRERVPVAWLPRAGCAVAADGRLLPHFGRREPGWIAVDGLSVTDGRVPAPMLADARTLAGLLAAGDAGPAGTLRRWGGGWEWDLGRRIVRCSSPASRAEAARLRRFQAAFPGAWDDAGRVDLRFADRIVVAAR